MTPTFRFEREGTGVVGRGVASRIELPQGYAAPDAWDRVRAALVDAGPDAVAIGALPFDPHAPASLVVPAEVDHGTVPVEPASPPGVAPDAFTLTSTRPHADFLDAVERAVRAIDDGIVEKVVLAREVVVEANRPIPVADVLERLRSLYPSCMLFSVDGFVGASPELLVARQGATVRSHPLAGTYPRSGDPAADARLADELLASDKDRAEHRFVIDALATALAPVCDELRVPEVPTIMQLRNVLHLGTPIEGRLARGDDGPSALELVARLSPTPAVGGTPSAPALALLRDLEQFDRGRYAGPVGWVDADGNGEFALGIRSAELDGRSARMRAGVGVVKGSVPEAELVETQLKLQALLAAVVRP